MEFVHKGNTLFVEENYQQACDQYTKAIVKLMGKQQFPALFGRARALMYLDKHSNAIRDFGECMSLNHTHQLVNYYLGVCLMKTGKHDIEKMKQAHKYLLIAQNGKSKQNRFEKAVGKVIKILQKLQPKIEIKNTINADNDNDNDNDNDIEMKTENPNTSDTKKDSKTSTEPKEQATVSKPKIKVRESWYQSANNITFTLYAKNLTAKDVSINYDINEVTVELKLPNGVFTRHIQLKYEVKPLECSHTMNKYKIILTLVKMKAYTWETLEEVIDNGKQPKSMIKAPWNTKKNWEQVDAYAAKELAKEKPEGDEALQSLFSKIYGDADDDQRRAMIKSFQTSNGTVLSTNWNDVKDKDYEGKDKVEPTGQNTAKWEY